MPRTRIWIGLIPVAIFGATATAQAPRVEVAFAAGASTSGLPAIAWLCSTALPRLDEWPSGLNPDHGFVVRITPDGLTISPNRVDLPEGSLATGSVEYESDKRALCSCAIDGTEDWYIPVDARAPLAWGRLLRLLRATDLNLAHTIDSSVAAGHLLGSMADGDLAGEAIQLGAALCGEVTWTAWHNDTHLRVRGRSGGGLLLPAILLGLAQKHGNGIVSELPMRAFISRDGDREEAVRQMARNAIGDRTTLLAMLHGSDELRLTAIDTLVRQGATEMLPRIVEAAALSLPLTTVAVADAVTTMWPHASEPIKARTRTALETSSAKALQNFDTSRIASQIGPVGSAIVVPWRLLTMMFVCAVGVFGFWLRARSQVGYYV